MKWFVIIFLVILGGLAAFGIVMDPPKPKTPEGLIADLKNPSAESRAYAVRTLGIQKEASAVPALSKKLNDTSEVVIRTKNWDEKEWKNERFTIGRLASESLRQFDGVTVIPPLIQALRSENEEIRRAALGQLQSRANAYYMDGSPEKWEKWWEENKRDEGIAPVRQP
jgi:HEAT repeat protein